MLLLFTNTVYFPFKSFIHLFFCLCLYRMKPKVTETEQNNDLGIEDDDIITGTQPPIPQHALFSAPQGQSQPVAKVFIERERTFTLSLTM